MKDKPKIVKMLREEEKLGRFQSKVQSVYNELELREEPSDDQADETIVSFEDHVKRTVGQNSLTHRGSKEEKRISGIDVIGDVSWGTHFCQFYQTKEDLIDILVPYFKAGLENNEFCMWVTSEPLHAEEAKNALTKVVKNLDDYIKKDQIEILDHTDWYAKSGRFEADKVLQGWVDKEKEALKRGFEGLRLTGNTFWLDEEIWQDFTEYERVVNSVIGNHRMIAICSYSLDKCDASEIVDVVSNHQFAIIRKEGEWKIIVSSEQKKAEDLLKESEEKWRSLVKNAPSIIMTLDREGTILFINHTVSGIAPEQVIGMNQYEFIQPKYRKIVKETIEQVFKTGNTGKYEIQGDGPNGTISWYRTQVGSITQGGKIVAVTLITDDITKRKKAEEELKESEEKFRTFVDTASDLMDITDKDGTFTDVNEAMVKTLGYSKEELIGMRITQILTKEALENDFKPNWEKFVTNREMNIETTLATKNGKEICGELKVVAIYGSDGKFAGGRSVFHDITERKKAEEKIKQQNIQLEKLDRIKTDFLNVTSHELRTPLAAMKGYLQILLKQTLGNVTTEQKDALNVVLRNTNRLDNLIEEILDISRLKSGTMKFITEKTDISKMIKEVTETVQANANMKNIKINTELEEVPELIIDQERIRQVLMNLVDNAIKFSPQGSTINLCTKMEEDNVLFEVQDFGRGIPRSKQKKIFERFYQVDSGVDRKFGGIGLGLTISQCIVNAHSGKIWVESSVGKGSTFRFTLPIKPVKDVESRFKAIDMFGLKNKEYEA